MPEPGPRDRGYAARREARSAAFRLALDSGASTVTRQSSFGDSTILDVEAAAGLRAARDLEQAARHCTLQYIRQAREAGYTWHDIGTVMRLTPDRDQAETTAEAAFTYATDPDSSYTRTYGPSFAWKCPSCTSTILDQSLDNGPADNERGHAENCPRLAATIEAWDAEWAAPDSDWEAEWDAPEAGQ